jgi:hypothetical protein
VIGVEAKVHCQSFGEAFVDAGAEQGYVALGSDGAPERETLRQPAGWGVVSGQGDVTP